MPAPNHVASWPDKAMFSAMTLLLAGGLGLLFEVGRKALSTVDPNAFTSFTQDIPFYTLGLCAATLVLGLLCLRTQAALYGYLGAATAILSVGLFGVVSLLGLAAIAFMVKAHAEGEETRNDGLRLSSDQWPDKALAASLVLFVGACVLAMQGALILAGRFQGTLYANAIEVPLDLHAAAATLVAARECFHLRRPALALAGALLLVATLAVYVLGPALGLTALVLLALARKEGEFDPVPKERARRQDERRRRKATGQAPKAS